TAMLTVSRLYIHFFSHASGDHRDLHSFPTRRSSDLPEVDLFLGFSDLHHLVPELASRGLVADPAAGHPGVRRFLGRSPHVRYLRSEEHTSELQSRFDLVCRLLLEKKKKSG